MPIAARDYDIPGGTVVRPTNNPYVNRWLESVRSRNGMAELIPKGVQGTRRIFGLLRKGHAILMLVDQRASEGILAPFFGVPAQTTVAPRPLHSSSAASCCGVERASGGARFRMRVYPPIPLPDTGDPNRDVVALTTAINAFVEARVRERPGQWLWIHKRWVGEDALLGKTRSGSVAGRGARQAPHPSASETNSCASRDADP
jgi:KDO2-lipid IV(A) lauroyltransferase